MDGKKLCRSHDGRHERDGIWMVSAWASENQIVLGQSKVDEKSHEITAIPQLLSQLDLSGCGITVDASNTQTTIAQQIVAAQADYIMAVKGNQGTFTARSINQGHGPPSLGGQPTSVSLLSAASQPMGELASSHQAGDCALCPQQGQNGSHNPLFYQQLAGFSFRFLDSYPGSLAD